MFRNVEAPNSAHVIGLKQRDQEKNQCNDGSAPPRFVEQGLHDGAVDFGVIVEPDRSRAPWGMRALATPSLSLWSGLRAAARRARLWRGLERQDSRRFHFIWCSDWPSSGTANRKLPRPASSGSSIALKGTNLMKVC